MQGNGELIKTLSETVRIVISKSPIPISSPVEIDSGLDSSSPSSRIPRPGAAVRCPSVTGSAAAAPDATRPVIDKQSIR